MTFSASSLTPEAGAGTDTWRRIAELVVDAVGQAAAQIPSAEPLQLQPPVPLDQADAAGVAMPNGTAITAYLSGGIEGKLLLVVAAELVEALAGTPFGAVEPAVALRPALETLATALGGRLDGSATAIAVEDCVDVLAGGAVVLVPLVAAGTAGAANGAATVHALVGVSVVAESSPGVGAVGGAGASWGIDMLRDVEMEVTCELGRTRMTVRQLLALAPGDVVELDRLAGSPADLLVNGTLLARGEVVVVDEAFGLRITEIVTRDER
jgi:flagellar motor switch protein FliN/FliY